MRALVQRVQRASVEVEGAVIGEIGPGLLMFVGVGKNDVDEDGGLSRARGLADKVANLRIFYDAEGKSNLSLLDTGGAALVISQFTLYADYRRGRRPSFSDAADPGPAAALVDVRMVATNRLTGHSPGFFSVYTLPPNQAASIASQKRINEKSQQAAVKKDIRKIILKKSGTLLKDLSTEEKDTLERGATHSQFLVRNCAETPEIPDESIHLVVTSPPFLDIVQYDQDNWLRCWFNGIDPKTVPIWQLRKEDDWQNAMKSVFLELNRVLVPNGIVAFEVGEIRNGKILMEDLVLPAAISSGLQPFAILINGQKFTKTSNCWGVDNALKGTNTNRVVLFQKTLDLQRTNWNFSDKQPKKKE